jgi:hypothetical protein
MVLKKNLLVTIELENKKTLKRHTLQNTLFRSCFTWEWTKYILVFKLSFKRQLTNRLVFVSKPTSINHIVTRIIRGDATEPHPGSSGWEIVFVGCEKY